MLIQLNGLVFLLGYYCALWRPLACFLQDLKHNSLAARGASPLTFHLHCSIWELCIINSIFRLKIEKTSLMSKASSVWKVRQFFLNKQILRSIAFWIRPEHRAWSGPKIFSSFCTLKIGHCHWNYVNICNTIWPFKFTCYLNYTLCGLCLFLKYCRRKI